MLDQFTSSDIDVFYGSWNIGARAKGQRLGTLRAFFRFCMNRKWLRETPISADVKPPIGANRVANKAPYTDEELQRIIDACDSLGEVAWSNGRENGVYTGEDVKDFIWVMVYTGLRISDVGLFNMSRLRQRGFSCGQRRTAETYSRTSRIGCGIDSVRGRSVAGFVRSSSATLTGLRPSRTCGAGKSARYSSWLAPLRNLPRPTVSVTPSRESCYNAACRLPMWPICSATMKKRFASTIRDGYPKDRHV